jgi:hypothetical protein
MSNYTISDYVQDLTGIRIRSLYGPNAILAVLWFTSILGLVAIFIPGLSESLYGLYLLGHPTLFIFLWAIIPIDILCNFKNITKRLSNIHHTNPEIRILNYLLFSSMALGFGLIFGTMGLFANTNDLSNYLFVMGISLSFSNICGIVARGYIRNSPIIDYFTTKITSRFPRLGYLW